MVQERIDIGKIVNNNLISMNLHGRNKKEVIDELSDLLVKDGDVVDKEKFVDDVFRRESEGETGIGQGVAIPHGKSKAVANTTIAIGLTKNSIPWESLDEQPINIIILFAVRDQDADTLHLKLLQQVAILLSDDGFIEKLRNSKTKKEVIELLSS
ncbi:PTS sugar transporter subunit IIA [Lactobacillus crispatus]|uniref:PTS sugar transporter subunit IIA n=1 Tax=Lactobacillus crispatus TaxID=47770 RepID=UPI00387348CB